MSQASQPSRPAESDDQSKRSSKSSSIQRSSPAQSQQKQGSFSQTDHSENQVRPTDRVRTTQRSTSTSDTDSDMEVVRPPPPKGSSGSSDAIKTQAATTGGQKQAQPILTQVPGSFTNGVAPGGSIPTERRKGRHRQEVIQCPPIQGAVRQVRNRLPTPEPDTIERVLVQRTGPEVIEEITEMPTTPPPLIQERRVVEPAGPPQIVKRVVRVPPRGTGAPTQQPIAAAPIQQPIAAAPVQYSDNLLNAGSYTGTPQFNAGFQPQAATSFPCPFGGAGNFPSGSGSFSAGGQPQAPIVFSVDANASPSHTLPPLGCHPAFCFYI